MTLPSALRRTSLTFALTVVAAATIAATGGVAVAEPTTATRPRITGLSPNHGCHRGGTTVVITGTGFTGTTQISFGISRTSAFTVDSDTTITVTTPRKAGAGRGSIVPVRVDTTHGQNVPSAAAMYQYGPRGGRCT